MLEIYRPHIVGSSVSFEYEVPSEKEFRERILKILPSLPWLVYEIDGAVVGYAYASRYRDRAAYQWSVETTVYVGAQHQRAGVARALYEALIASLKKQNYLIAYGVITLPNPKSVAFHEALGFKPLCVYPKAGFKLGKWHDVGWWRLELGEFPEEPVVPTDRGSAAL